MLFWVLLSAAVSVVFGSDEKVCFGQEFTIGPIIIPRNTMVIFKPRSPPRSNVFLFQNEMVQDSRYQWKNGFLILQEATDKDEGTFTFWLVDRQREYKTVNLIVNDCSDTQYMLYGDNFHLELSENAAALYFSLQDSPSHSELLWNKTNPRTSRGGRGWVRGRFWLLDKMIHSDQGYYTQRTREGRFITRLQVDLQADRGHFNLSPGDSLTLPLKIPLSEVQVYFTSDENDYSNPIQLVRDGLVVPQHGMGHISLWEGWLEIDQVSSSNRGRYKVRDKDNHLVYSASLNVAGTTDLKYLPLLGLVIVAVLFCICIKKLCCKKKPATPAVPITYGEDSSPTYPLAPSVQSQPPWGETPGPSTPGYTSLMDNVSRPTPATEGGSSLPSYPPIQEVGGKKNFLSSDCLHSSDSGIQFEFGKGGKNKDYFSALPLNSDTPETSNVYTSDKLNFL